MKQVAPEQCDATRLRSVVALPIADERVVIRIDDSESLELHLFLDFLHCLDDLVACRREVIDLALRGELRCKPGAGRAALRINTNVTTMITKGGRGMV